MGVDFPDFQKISLFNLKLQELSEVINRPKYGGALLSEDTVELTASGEHVFVTVEGKGMLYGGFISSVDSNIVDTDVPRLRVDDQLISSWSWDALRRYNFSSPNALVFYLLCYDEVAPTYAVALSYGITFETSLSLRYYCTTADSRYISYSLLYALV